MNEGQLTQALTEWYPPRTALETALLGAARAMSEEATLGVLLDRILADARALTRAEAGTIFLVEGDHLKFAVVQNDLLAARFGHDDMQRRFNTHPLPLNEPSIAAHVALTGRPLNLEDAYANHMLAPVFYRGVDADVGYITRSILAVPLRSPAGSVVGVMQLLNAMRDRHVITAFSPGEIEIAEGFASLSAVAIHRALLEEATALDPLTDLYNRRYLTLRIQEEVSRHKRFEHPVSVVAMDVDGFERINQASGHFGGDAVLREVSRLLRRNSRQFSCLGRVRADDFVAVLPNTPQAGAVAYAERIKSLMAAHAFEQGALTASFGVACLSQAAATSEDLLAAAHRSVTAAKREGGNRVAAA